MPHEDTKYVAVYLDTSTCNREWNIERENGYYTLYLNDSKSGGQVAHLYMDAQSAIDLAHMILAIVGEGSENDPPEYTRFKSDTLNRRIPEKDV